ncbi:MAG: alanine racemase [Planctomycetaceae bacterium]
MASQLRLDLDVLEQNADLMASDLHVLGRRWRPHVKAHCQPLIATALLQRNACGVTVATVSEAEVMAAAGMPSILLAHLVVTEDDRRRLAAVASQTELLLTIDHFVHAELLSQTATRTGQTLSVLVDVNVGMNRTGCRPRVDATQLALAAAGLPGLKVAGIMGYEGHLSRLRPESAKRQEIMEAMNALEQTRDSMLQRGLACDIVSAGGSGTYRLTAQHPAVTELQCGGGIFGDPFYRDICGLSGIQPALTVVADVVSRPSLTQAVLNCGRKAINPFIHPPEVLNPVGAEVDSLTAEHCVLTVSGAARDLKIGDQVTLAVGYSDHTILMHREIHVFRGTEQVDQWSVIR